MRKFGQFAIATLVLLVATGSAQSQEAKTGGTLTVGVVSDPVTLDPALMSSFFEIYTQYLIHEPLLKLSPNLKISPGLAESFTEVSDTVYTLKLRRGLTFHDGTVLDAAAVKWNMDRMLDPATNSPRRSELGPLRSVEVLDPLTVRFTLTEPYSPFPSVLTNRAGMMVSPTAVQALGKDFGTKAVGAGPFKVVRWVKNNELVLEKFDNYYLEGRPYLDRVVIRPIPDETVRLTNLLSNTIGLVDVVPPKDLSRIRTAANVEVQQQPGLGFNHVELNHTRAPFNDPRVRQAFMHAIDPAVIQRIVYFNTGSPAVGPISPAMTGFYDRAFKPYAPDAAKARALLAAAGKPNPAISLKVTNSPIQLQIAQILQSQLRAVGFNVKVEQVDATSLITVLRQKDFDAIWAPWSGRPDPDGNMFNYFTKTGPNNFRGYLSDKVDALLNQARTTTDATARARLYREAQAQIAADVGVAFLHHDAVLHANTSRLEGFVAFPDGGFRLENAWLR